MFLTLFKQKVSQYNDCGFITAFLYNKDHQRMMVDPMFMIVQSLRSFLTAVTTTAVIPTAVAPIAVILPKFT